MPSRRRRLRSPLAKTPWVKSGARSGPDGGRDQAAEGIGIHRAAKIARALGGIVQYRVHGRVDGGAGGLHGGDGAMFAEPRQHHRGREDQGRRVGAILAGDIRAEPCWAAQHSPLSVLAMIEP